MFVAAVGDITGSRVKRLAGSVSENGSKSMERRKQNENWNDNQ